MNNHQNTLITVPKNDRLAFLPRLFGKFFLQGETTVYNFMQAYVDGYNGGYYDFHQTPCGASFMACTAAQTYQVDIDTNYFSRKLTAETTGIIATLFSLSINSLRYQSQHLSDQYQALLAYAQSTPDSAAIFSAID